MPLDAGTAGAYTEVVDVLLGAYRALERMQPAPAAPLVQRSHRVPGPGEDPYHAWTVRSSIRTSDHGLLLGRSIGVKDNILVAGLPTGNGSDFLEGYVPSTDATVVSRVLDEGGEIVGKNVCEYLCLSGGSHTSHDGPTHNPHRRGYSSGGSSSGSAVAIALGECDMALGCDQAGSIRMPAAWSGIVGMKPTYGLVPYSGILQISTLIDHVGPMSRSVADNALLLQVIAGEDGLDSRQRDLRVQPYSELLHGGVAGMRIGVLEQGFGRPESEAASDAVVRDAAELLRRLGAQVDDVSVPMHLDAPAVWAAIASGGLAHHTLQGEGFGVGFDQLLLPDAMQRLKGWSQPGVKLSVSARAIPLADMHVRRTLGLSLYARAFALRWQLRAAYDEALSRYDLLLMPTMPMKAQPLPADDAPLLEQFVRTSEMFGNTCPFDITHHPAISVPCGSVEGLPIGLMLVGRHFDEATIYRAAHAFEQANGDGAR